VLSPTLSFSRKARFESSSSKLSSGRKPAKMKHTLLQITSLLFFVFSSSVFAKLGGNQPVVPVGGNGVLTVPVHRKPTLPGDPGADKRQVDTDLLNPLYGLSYFVDRK